MKIESEVIQLHINHVFIVLWFMEEDEGEKKNME